MIDFDEFTKPDPDSSMKPVLEVLREADIERLWSPNLVIAWRLGLLTAEDLEVMSIQGDGGDWRRTIEVHRRLCVKIIDRWRAMCDEQLDE
jgi:hypothetical protein